MLAAWRAEISTSLVRGQAAKSGNQTALAEAQNKLLGLAKEFDSTASTLGLTVCAANP